MPKHEDYEQLCALAMVGDASPDELLALRSHLQECEDCRREYREFAQLVLPQLWAMDDGGVGDARPSQTQAASAKITDTSELRASFLHRAQAQGISFSAATLAAEEPAQSLTPIPMPVRNAAPRQPRVIEIRYAAAIAAVLLLAVLVWRMPSRTPANQPVAANVTQLPNLPQSKPNPANPRDPAATQLATELAASHARQDELQQSLTRLQAQLAAANADRDALSKQIAQKSSELAALQTDASASQQTVTSLRADVAALQARADLNAATYRDAQVKVQELTAQLEQQRNTLDRDSQLLLAGKDMRDMMGARNLHIVDVFDTNGEGKTSSAFGRVFFAEDRKLVFYAYDLNEKRLQNARYDYRIWGQREGQPQTARSLGIFYSDDKTERRWVFKLEDPRVLSQIDSVFVTLERTDADAQHPRGAKLMYAYLRGQPNHP